ncbi:hypothetical protein DVS28_b0008 (plasmid) [Euzebya pacifica]|uniref:Lipoprotein n=1 Tax=Euzebya pacifica TaxID=1608957 RepID=A0A346Y5N1_9ACTN|nr:hypothetical protein [Euzebya pacifica]AXV09778.1 hypothetical protein DVS28_b0008 [Euzebya pacifica]
MRRAAFLLLLLAASALAACTAADTPGDRGTGPTSNGDAIADATRCTGREEHFLTPEEGGGETDPVTALLEAAKVSEHTPDLDPRSVHEDGTTLSGTTRDGTATVTAEFLRQGGRYIIHELSVCIH